MKCHVWPFFLSQFDNDNAPVHKSRVAQAECGFQHPPYSPDLAPSTICRNFAMGQCMSGDILGENTGAAASKMWGQIGCHRSRHKHPIFLFRNLKSAMRGRHFRHDNDVKAATVAWLGGKSEDFYKSGIKSLKEKWNKCIEMKGGYIEK